MSDNNYDMNTIIFALAVPATSMAIEIGGYFLKTDPPNTRSFAFQRNVLFVIWILSMGIVIPIFTVFALPSSMKTRSNIVTFIFTIFLQTAINISAAITIQWNNIEKSRKSIKDRMANDAISRINSAYHSVMSDTLNDHIESIQSSSS